MSASTIHKKRLRLLMLLLLIPPIILLSLKLGYTSVKFEDLLRILFGGGSAKENMILFQFRMPRIVMAILSGIGFSVAGCILQGLSKNPLADPGILGINAGGSLVVVLFLTSVGTLSFHSIFLMPLFSLLGAALSGLIIYRLSSHRYKGLQSISLVLNGIAVNAGLSALMMLLVLSLDDSQHDFLARWQAGSIWNSNWQLVIALLPWIIVGLAIAFAMSKELDVLALGESTATALGLKTKKIKRQLLFLAITLSASSVAMCGSIAFLGLMGPHIARGIVGVKHRYLVPATALTGAILMMVSDVIARLIASPLEMPTGIVVAAIGAPYFLYLLMGGRQALRRKKA